MSDRLTVGSLFSGIGGIDLGLERAGIRVIWQCENHPYARRVLAKHWPDIPCYEDVRTINGSDGSIDRPDVLCGGFPCQDISFAGKGAGLDGERSGLWFEYERVIREFRPRYVLVENVAALLVRGLDRVLGSLASLGYDAEWEGISAASIGANHLRKRIFIVAYPSISVGGQRSHSEMLWGRTDETEQIGLGQSLSGPLQRLGTGVRGVLRRQRTRGTRGL